MTRIARLIFLLTVTLLGVIVCAAPLAAAPPYWPNSVDALLSSARQGIPTIDMADYLKVVRNPEGALILDVRERSEFAAGHVPGAINIPRGLIEFAIWRFVGYPDKPDYDRTIYVQCRTGARASLAARSLKELGLTHVVIVLMDFRDWEKAGNPVVREAAK